MVEHPRSNAKNRDESNVERHRAYAQTRNKHTQRKSIIGEMSSDINWLRLPLAHAPASCINNNKGVRTNINEQRVHGTIRCRCRWNPQHLRNLILARRAGARTRRPPREGGRSPLFVVLRRQWRHLVIARTNSAWWVLFPQQQQQQLVVVVVVFPCVVFVGGWRDFLRNKIWPAMKVSSEI